MKTLLADIEVAEKYRSIFENAVEGIYQSTPDGQILAVNPALARLLGYESPEALISSHLDMEHEYYVDADTRTLFKRLLEEREIVYGLEYQAYRRDGSRIWVLENARAVRDEEGSLLYYEGSIEEITERRRAEAEREVIFEIVQGVNTTANLDELLWLIHQALKKVIYAENCFVALYDAATGYFHKPFHQDKCDQLVQPWKMGKSCTAYVFRTGRPLLMTLDAFEQLIEQGEVEAIGTPSPSWLGVPLKTPTETIGVLVVQHYEEENIYSQRDVEFLSSVAGQIALAIDRKRSEEALRKAHDELERRVQERTSERQVLFEIMQGVSSTSNLDELLRLIHQSLGRVLYAENCFVSLYDKATGFFHKRFYVDKFNPNSSPQMMAKSCSAYVFRTGRPLLMSPQMLDEMLERGDIELIGVRSPSWLGVPLKTATETIGVLVVQHYTDPHAYSERDVEFLSSVGSQIAVAIERKRAEEALRESEERYKQIINHASDIMYRTDVNGRFVFVNPVADRLLKYPVGELIGVHYSDLVRPDLRAETVKFYEEQFAQRIESTYYEFPAITKDGAEVWLGQNVQFIIERGKIGGFQSVARDITERKRAEEALQEANQRAVIEYERLLERIAQLGQTLGTARDLLTVFRALRDFAVISTPCDSIIISLYDDERNVRTTSYAWTDGQEVEINDFMHVNIDGGRIGRALKTQKVVITHDFRNYVKNGNHIFIDPAESNREPDSALLAPMSVMGKSIGLLEIQSYEVSAYRNEHSVAMNMAANLTAIAIENVRLFEREREKEEQLRQSQKMEAVGKLAGGVAHDFNNLLTAITGYSDLSLRRVAEGHPLRRNLEEIKKAGERAATLTRQLLAFSRKQMLQPKVLDLNAVIVDMFKMLQRLIGEDVDLLSVLQPTLGQVKADPGQIHQVLMNLSVNARDAMPHGGKLTIKTSNIYVDEEYALRHVSVQPGNYVLLSISDTGCGMDAETQERIFEPFFTTKELGKGTGLGLSTVYGIVKQSGGNIWVYSEVGKGTTFKVYLPRFDEAPEHHDERLPVEKSLAGTETILLVEDEEMVRDIASQALEQSGYRVLVASDTLHALELCREHAERIDLMLTDVVMPQMSGRVLAERVAPLRPEMRVLYMSGYTDDHIVHHGVLEEGMNFIEKPFTADQLARKVREVLNTQVVAG
ncbi:MAG TPA: PAS domain S-box protein [Pyrinomonadaceae bacterium]